jgi:prepilin-type N-terminal cleavage/methylation domain-containing protein
MKILNPKGVTLVELLIALVMSTLIAAAGFAIYVRAHQTYLAQVEVSDTQFRVRDALRQLANNMQMAGYLLPVSLSPIQASNTNPDTVVICSQSVPPCQPTLFQAMAQPTSDLRCDGQDLTGCFVNGDRAYIYDPTAKTGEFFIISQVNYATSLIQHSVGLSKSYPISSIVMKIESQKYYIDQTTVPAHPRLMVSLNGAAPTVYANDVEDLQIVYTLADGSTSSSPASTYLVREADITLRGKTQKSDVDWNKLYRKRTFSTRVKVRNLDL